MPVDDLALLLRWRGGSAEAAVEPALERWLKIDPTLDELRATWSGRAPTFGVTEQDLLDALRRLRLSPADALAILERHAADPGACGKRQPCSSRPP